MRRAFIIMAGDKAVHQNCTYRGGITKLTSSLNQAKTWAKAKTAQQFIDTAYRSPQLTMFSEPKVVEIAIGVPPPDIRKDDENAAYFKAYSAAGDFDNRVETRAAWARANWRQFLKENS